MTSLQADKISVRILSVPTLCTTQKSVNRLHYCLPTIRQQSVHIRKIFRLEMQVPRSGIRKSVSKQIIR
jgi:hypothetical protein